MKTGKGIWRKSEQDPVTNTYEGDYQDDMKHGLGEFKWASGGYYRGNYQNDVKTGYGEMYWADGSVYKGCWANGVQNGLGIMTFANGITKAGIFKDNVLVEIVTDHRRIEEIEGQSGNQFPQTFKQELRDLIEELNLKESKKHLDTKG